MRTLFGRPLSPQPKLNLLLQGAAWLITALVLLSTGCVTGPTKEAAQVKLTGDQEVLKLKYIAEDFCDKDFTARRQRVVEVWEEGWKKAQGADGKVSAEFAEAYITKKNLALTALRLLEEEAMQDIDGLYTNYVRASGGLYEEWERQGKLTAAHIEALREFGVTGLEMYRSHQKKKAEEKAAKKALEAMESEE